MRKGMEIGADDYLTKPFGYLELLSAIECRLKKKHQQKLSFSQSLDQIEALFSGKKGLEELKKLASERRSRKVRRKQVIYYDGDTVGGIYLVLSGNIKTFKVTDDGRELLTGVYGPEEYFGLAALLSGEDYKETAEAMEDTSLCLLPRGMVEELIAKYHERSETRRE